MAPEVPRNSSASTTTPSSTAPDSRAPTHKDARAHAGSSRAGARVIGILVAAYIALILALALSDRFTFVWKTSVVPALLVTSLFTRQATRFLRDWAPLVGGVVLFDSLRGFVFGLITGWRLPFYARYAIDAEEALFGGHTLPNLVQSVFLQDGMIGLPEKALVVVHGSHFFAFLVFGFAVWLLRGDSFGRFCAALFSLLLLGLALYLAVPTVPPWMAASRFHLIPPVQHVTAQVYNTVSPVLGQTFDVNPIAAMPSLHTAIPVLCSLIAWTHFRARGLVVAAYTAAVCVAIVYLGEHYSVDVLAGAALATVVYLLIYRTALLQMLRSCRLVSAARGLASRFPTVAPIALGLLMAISAEMLGQVSVDMRRPIHVDEAFVRRELVGKSDVASLALARFALQRGDKVLASRLLEQALTEVRRDEDRASATELLHRISRNSALLPHASQAR